MFSTVLIIIRTVFAENENEQNKTLLLLIKRYMAAANSADTEKGLL